MGLFDWLFAKRKGSPSAGGPEGGQPAVAAAPQREAPAYQQPATSTVTGGQESPSCRGDGEAEAENLRRWEESGQARAWVEARHGRWDHDDWLALLEQLRRSAYWPMHPDALGLALEKAKREWLQRN